MKTPKTYIRDSGLTHALLELETRDQVLGHPVAGASWQGFAIESLIAAAGERRTPYYYRTAEGAEVDLLFERAGEVEMMIEIKRSTAPTLSKGFHFAQEAPNPKAAYLVHAGSDSWPAGKGVTAISLTGLMERLASSLRH